MGLIMVDVCWIGVYIGLFWLVVCYWLGEIIKYVGD